MSVRARTSYAVTSMALLGLFTLSACGSGAESDDATASTPEMSASESAMADDAETPDGMESTEAEMSADRAAN